MPHWMQHLVWAIGGFVVIGVVPVVVSMWLGRRDADALRARLKNRKPEDWYGV